MVEPMVIKDWIRVKDRVDVDLYLQKKYLSTHIFYHLEWLNDTLKKTGFNVVVKNHV